MLIATMNLHDDHPTRIDQSKLAPDQAGVGALPLRIGFWGTHSLFSQQILRALLTYYPIALVALPAADPMGAAVALWQPPPVTQFADELLIVNNTMTSAIVQDAWRQQIPLYEVQHLHSPLVAHWLAEMTLDLVCVACFPWRIPATLLRRPTYGFLNIHPSLLPAYRGPAPLFWQLRDGLPGGGVTVHWMDAAFDTGPIAAQSALRWPDGASSADLDRLCAATGADLLGDILCQLAQGRCPRQPQPPGGSQQGWPTADDFRLETQWSARHAYNFMCGTDEWRQPYPLNVAGEELLLRRALAYAPDQQLVQPLVRTGGEVAIQFRLGVLRALLW